MDTFVQSVIVNDVPNGNALKGRRQRMKIILRVLLLATLLYQINMTFILFPRKNVKLNLEFEKVMEIVKKHCEPSQYYLPQSITIEFDRLYEEVAYCQRRINGFKLVFDERYWNNMLAPIDRTQLMIHEMTHCLFKQDHVSDPKHFMAPFFYSIPEDVLYVQFDEFLRGRCGK
jgi:hypothetical protein